MGRKQAEPDRSQLIAKVRFCLRKLRYLNRCFLRLTASRTISGTVVLQPDRTTVPQFCDSQEFVNCFAQRSCVGAAGACRAADGILQLNLPVADKLRVFRPVEDESGRPSFPGDLSGASRTFLGDTPNQVLTALEKVLSSEKPSR